MVTRSRYGRSKASRFLKLESLEARHPMAAYISELQLGATPYAPHIRDQYIELRGEAKATLPNGTYFVAIHNTDLRTGEIYSLFNLSGLQFGDNGYLVLSSSWNRLTANPAARELRGTQGFYGMPNEIYESISLEGDLFLLSTSFLLLQSPTPPTIGLDIDADDNGVPDGDYSRWTILDGLARFASQDRFTDLLGYAPISFLEQGIGSPMPGTTAVTTDFTAYFARINHSTGYQAEDWVAAGATEELINGTWNINNLRLGRHQITPLHVEYTNYLLDHLGSDNWHAPATVQVFRDDNANGIQDSGEPPIPGAIVTAALQGQAQGGINSETIDPFAFAIEEDLTNVSANVTLTVAGISNPDVLHPILWQSVNAGSGMFFSGAQSTFLNDSHLRMDFYRPAQSVSILVGNAVSFKPVYGRLEIFDSHNRSLGFVRSSALEKGEEERLAIFSPSSDIAYAVAYSDFEYLDSSMDGWFGSLKFTWPTEAATTDANGSVKFYQLPRESYQFSVSVPPEYDIVYPQTGTHLVEFTAASKPTSLTFGVRGNRPPRLHDLSGAVRESAIAGQVIAKLPIELGYGTQAVRATITGGDDQGLFTIDPVSQELKLSRPTLDFESQSRYSLSLLIEDVNNAALNDTALFELTIEDVNEAPSIGSVSLSVAENVPAGAPIGTIPVLDPDQGDQWRLELLSQTVPWFVVDPQSGAVNVRDNAAVNYEQHQQVELVVRALDKAGLSRTSTVTVTVTDQNDRPILVNSLPGLRTLVGQRIDYTIPSTTFADEDATDTLRLRATQAGGEPLPGWLAFDELTAKLTGTPGKQQIGNLELSIQAIDQGGLTAVSNLVILVDPNPKPLHNPNEALDVTGDRRVTPLDALLIINFINTQGSRAVTPEDDSTAGWLDASADNTISPIDALLVINELNRTVKTRAAGESIDDWAPTASTPIIAAPIITDHPLNRILTGGSGEDLKKRSRWRSHSRTW